MALIKCPECGREKVSDTAEACPDCGYGIKAHFDAIKRQRQKQEIYEMKLQSVSMPDKPKRMNAWFGLAIFAGVVTIGSLLSSESLLVVILMFLFSVGCVMEVLTSIIAKWNNIIWQKLILKGISRKSLKNKNVKRGLKHQSLNVPYVGQLILKKLRLRIELYQ